MFKLRLIESFTWLFMEVEKVLMEDIDISEVNLLSNIYFNNSFYCVLTYLTDMQYYEGMKGHFDLLEAVEHLYDMEQVEKVVINKEVMEHITEADILKLIDETVKLIQFLKMFTRN